jgi:hypothetical protein
MDGVEIAKAAMIPAGTKIPPAYPGAPAIGPLPAHCRVDGVINRSKGADGEEFSVGFALVMPDATAWNGDFMMQSGSDGNGVVPYPLGASYAGDKPALVRGFAVASTDTGHKAKAGPFDFSFMRDQQSYLDFAYQAMPMAVQRRCSSGAKCSCHRGCATSGEDRRLPSSTCSEQWRTGLRKELYRSSSSLRGRHFLVEAGRWARIPNTPSTWGMETRTTLITSNVSEVAPSSRTSVSLSRPGLMDFIERGPNEQG